MTERLEEPPASADVPAPVRPVDPEREVARKNAVFGWALFGLFLLLFAGVWVIAYLYLAFD
ncbi:MAG: hypothetical protein ACXW0F_12015 [Gaiellaceae bacterium]